MLPEPLAVTLQVVAALEQVGHDLRHRWIAGQHDPRRGSHHAGYGYRR